MIETRIGGATHVTVTQAAQRKRVSRAAVWLACKTQRLPCRRLGGRIYIPLRALAKWRPRRPPVSPPPPPPPTP